MNNISEYIKWRGDLTFAQDPLNEIDGLVFSIIAYSDFKYIVSGVNDTITLREAADRFFDEKDISHLKEVPFLKDIPEFLYLVSRCNRFKDLLLSNYVEETDMEETVQFCAVTFTLPDGSHFIAFRGTDDSLVGWKEDLNMSFLEEVPAQAEGVVYTDEIMEQLRGDFVVGGHSKGGNIAVYSAIRCNETIKDRIKKIYNYDGPGFHETVIQSSEYKKAVEKVLTYLPESSIVGLMLEQKAKYKVVKSSGLALMQHDPFIWKVEGKTFLYGKELSKKSKDINDTIKAWLKHLNQEERAGFVDALFSILEETGVSTIGEMNKEKFSVAFGMIKAYTNLESNAKEHLKTVMDILIEESQRTFKNSIGADIQSFFRKDKNKNKK
ncbi:DUF2974 domain-containing protein [Alkalibacter mobilis]|uniref:DUF2974 domain-containing protein n=1 Tax=Alkalibacter mobilis TaxID=2787712 RepID=UPI00189E7CEB|nr:DUF2974 domain-containing protein [Alkalibacter mobilis]MBF7095563.1 DUF2974 domain-containing protein [Alkalibacter mobilis]